MSKRIFEIDLPEDVETHAKRRISGRVQMFFWPSDGGVVADMREIDPAASEWFPIEEAPKDCGYVLLEHDDGHDVARINKWGEWVCRDGRCIYHKTIRRFAFLFNPPKEAK